MKRITVTCLLCGSILAFVAVCINAEESIPSAIDSPVQSGPHILFDHSSWEFGAIIEGSVVEHYFPFKNTGSETLHILEVRASCGCTRSGSTSSAVAPGETAAVFAEFNSEGKRGKIVKSVFVKTNDSATPDVTLLIEVDVLPDTSLAMKNDDTGAPRQVMSVMASIARKPGQNIFDTSCRPCHVDPARGKRGKALYEAACAMCHGNNDHPVVHGASAITGSNYLRDKSIAHLRVKISKGTPNPMMPGFDARYGGPLSASQIQSLLLFFRNIKDSVPIHTPPNFARH